MEHNNINIIYLKEVGLKNDDDSNVGESENGVKISSTHSSM